MVIQQCCRTDYRLPRERRIKAAKLFKDVFTQGRRITGSLMVMLVRTGTGTPLRLGVAAGRKIGDAVDRNRAKRRLREALRLNRRCLQEDCDIILLARHKVLEASWNEVQSELIDLAGKAGILKNEKSEVSRQ